MKMKEVEFGLDDKIYYCVGCGKTHPKGDFYVSYSANHANGRLFYCKDFIKKKIYNSENEVNIEKLKNILMQFDIPFLKDTFDSAITNGGDVVGNYFRMFNSLPQNRGLTWMNSDFGLDATQTSNEKSINIESNEDEVLDNAYLNQAIYSKEWRGTYTRADLEYLDNYYNELQKDFKIVTKNHKDYARKIAKASFAMDKAYDDMMGGVNGSDKRYKDLKDTFDSLSKSAQFAEDKRGQNDVSLGCFGVTFDKVEQKQWIPQHTPLEKDDYDLLIEYFSTINKSM